MKNPHSVPVYEHLGRYLESLRCSHPVDGRLLSVREVCRRASMSATTYIKVKKGLV